MDNVNESETRAVFYRRPTELSVDLLFELFLRLPLRKLFQCMRVSEVWRSVIRQPRFVRAYYLNLSPSRDLLFSIPEKNRLHFYYSTREVYNKLENYDELFSNSCSHLSGVTQVVNGLFCFYNWSQVFLANVFSGETVKLPCSRDDAFAASFLPRPDFDASYNYSFGFDPVDRVYKLLYIWRIRKQNLSNSNSDLYESRILTVGRDSSWRKLDAPQLDFLHENQGLCVNGVLYWIDEKTYGKRSMSFNLREEKFSSIWVPAIHWAGFKFGGLMQFRGQLSFFITGNQNIVFRTLEDEKGWVWSSGHQVILPAALERSYYRSLVPIGTLLTGEILLTGEVVLGANSPTMPVFSYNCESKEFEKFSMSELPKSVDVINKIGVARLVSSVPENFETLEAMIQGCLLINTMSNGVFGRCA